MIVAVCVDPGMSMFMLQVEVLFWEVTGTWCFLHLHSEELMMSFSVL